MISTNIYNVTAQISCGPTIQEHKDIILDCSSKKAAKQKFLLWAKKELPSWKKLVSFQVS